MPAELFVKLTHMARSPHTSDPDEQIQQAVRAALLASGYRTVGAIECTVIDGEITLSGTVESYFLKQIAQETVLQLGAIRGIRNAIRVSTREERCF